MEILFENPIILMALIGLVSTLFSKGKKEEEKRRRPPQRPAGTPGHTQQPAQASTIERKKEKLENRAKRAAAQMEQQYTQARQKAEDELESLNNRHRTAERQTETLRTREPIKKTAQSQSFAPDKKKLADAVIWSEILGPPRAMNPHRSVKRK
ncbi:hypothetical protein [Cytobacillus gottheilii]|uniref:hypothetical protein n=1 Tax=Cytobacillus gottheilii TaxID=859144 RepID=UPI0009B9F5B9|nr:hypothetical protein [Cytobacillus gottheilii]